MKVAESAPGLFLSKYVTNQNFNSAVLEHAMHIENCNQVLTEQVGVGHIDAPIL